MSIKGGRTVSKPCSRVLASFIFRYECRDWASTYAVALRILNEEACKQWTPDDVIKAVMRAVDVV